MFDATQQLTKLLVSACVVISLMLLQWQSCPSALASENNVMVICTDDGLTVVEISDSDTDPSNRCSRCLDCQTCSTGSFNEPSRASFFVPSFDFVLASMPTFETLHIGLPDHLLPFSGAPPPEKLDQTMLHTFFVPVRFASPTASIMPEIFSWH